MDQPILALVALVCLAAAAVWGRSARYRHRVLRRIERDSDDIDLQELTRSDYRKDLLATVLYGSLFVACAVEAVTSLGQRPAGAGARGRPRRGVAAAGAQLRQGGPARARAHRARAAGRGGARARRSWPRSAGPSAWPPRTCPTSTGFEVGRVYQAGSGPDGRRLLRRVPGRARPASPRSSAT